jgi:hypothetical protein
MSFSPQTAPWLPRKLIWTDKRKYPVAQKEPSAGLGGDGEYINTFPIAIHGRLRDGEPQS